MIDWAAAVTAGIAVGGALVAGAKIFSRAESSDLQMRLKMAESRIEDLRAEVREHYDYFYKQTHDLANFLDQTEKRIHLLEFRLQVK